MLTYKGHPVLASEAAIRKTAGMTIEIGPPEIVAAKDDCPDEGICVGPRLAKFGDTIYLNWKFDRDVVDGDRAARPNGRMSQDGGLTWTPQTDLMPGSIPCQTGPSEITSWGGNGFELPGQPGVYKIPTWRSPDLGQTWSDHAWTTVAYPGTKGLDSYDPPSEYRKRDLNFLGGLVKTTPPAYLDPFYREVSRLRGPTLRPQAADVDGTLYSMVYSRYLKDTSDIRDWDRDYWRRLNWFRYAVLMQVSRDHGRTWTFGGVPVDGSDYEPRVEVKPGGSPNNEHDFVVNPSTQIGAGFKGRVDFYISDGFSEPALVVFPDGEMLCALRTGHGRPLYCIRSYDRGQTWTNAELLSPRYLSPICGVNPKLVLLPNGVLALGTGRPDCTLHFSRDRGKSWFLSETLFATTDIRWSEIFSSSHSNVSMIAVDDHTLLYAHDASRPDPAAPHPWLQKAGHGLIIVRRIKLHAEC